jgi:hypothetical protein
MTDGKEGVKRSPESPSGSFSSSSHIAAIFLIQKFLFGVDDMNESCRGCLECFALLNQVALARASAAVLSQRPPRIGLLQSGSCIFSWRCLPTSTK